MAALQFYVNVPSTALAASTATTVAAVIAPTNQRVKVLAYGFYFDGTLNSAAPVALILGAFTGGSGFQAATPVKVEPELTETIQSTCKTWLTGQTEGTFTAYKTFTAHPQLGYEYMAPLGQEDIIKGGTQWGCQVNAAATVDLRGYVKCEE